MLWALPFVVLSLGIWRVQEARSWQPRVFPLARSTFASSDLAPMPLTWRHDGLWLLARPASLPTATGPKLLPSAVWQDVPNWNGQTVSLFVAARFLSSPAALARHVPVVVRGRDDEVLEAWREGKWRLAREKPVPNRFNLQKPKRPDVMALALSPDGSRFASGSHLYGLFDSQQRARGFSPLGIVLWEAATGRQIARQSAIEGAFTSLAFSDDGNALAGATSDGYLFIFDAKTGQKRRVWRAHRWLASGVAWSPDGKSLVSGANPRSRYGFQWKFGIGEFGGGTMGGRSTSRGDNGEKVVIVTDQNGTTSINGQSDRDLKLWDAHTGKLRHRWQSASGITSLQWSPDGKQIAVGTHGEALLFDAQNWKISRRFPLPKDAVSPASVAFSPDGRTLAVGSTSALTLWRLR